MNPLVARVGRAAAAAMGFRVTRVGSPARFSGMAETLQLLRQLGYAPRIVIDGGANVGQWYTIARRVFPAASYSLIEPQHACFASLSALDGRPSVHQVVISAPGASVARMIGATGDGSPGAFVARPGEQGPGEIVPATTLDALFAGRIAVSDRALLKLDLEGHELQALEGATELLRVAEVVIAETRFYDFGGARPCFVDLLEFLRARGFDLFDIAALSGRRRDDRLKMGDVVFVRRDSPLTADTGWE